MVEQSAVNRLVVGSSPTHGAILMQQVLFPHTAFLAVLGVAKTAA